MKDTILNIQNLNTRQASQSMLFALCNDITGTGFYSSGGDGNIVHWPQPYDEEGVMIARSCGQVMCLFLDAEFKRLLAGSLDGILTVIDLNDNTLISSIKVLKGGIFEFIKNELGYFIVGDDGAVTQLNTDTFKPHRGLQLSNSRCRALFSIDGYFYAGVTEGRLYKVDPFRLNDPIHSEDTHTGSVFSITGYNGRILSAGKDGKIMAWDEDLMKVDEIQAHNSTINSLTLLGDTGILVSACRDGSIRLWDAESLELLKVIDLYLHSGHLRSVNKVIWNDAGKLLISCSDDKKVKIWTIG